MRVGWLGERAVTRGCPCGLGDWDLRRFQSIQLGRASLDATLSHPWCDVGGVRRSESRVGRRGWSRCWLWPSPAGLRELADEHLRVPTDKGANAGLKVASLVGGMVAGADSIDDMALLRHGGMGRVFARRLRALDVGLVPAGVHLRPRPPARRGRLPVPVALAGLTPALVRVAAQRHRRDRVRVGRCRRHHRRGPRPRQAGRRVRLLRGPRAERAAGHASRPRRAAPVIVAQRLRKGACGSPRGAKRLVADAVKTTGGCSARPARRCWCGWTRRSTAAARSTPRWPAAPRCRSPSGWTRRSRRRSPAIDDDAWTTIEYTDAVFDETPGAGSPGPRSPRSPFTAFAVEEEADQVPGGWSSAGSRTSTPRRTSQPARTPCSTCGGSTRSSPPPTRDPRHRRRGQDPPPARDHRAGPRRPEELRAGAPALRGVHRQRRLAGARGDRVQPHPRRRHPDRAPALARATTATIRRKLISVPARVATSARRMHPAPADRLALGDRLDRAVRPGRGPTATLAA